MKLRGSRLLAVVVAVSVAACSALFEDPAQCSSDLDCERFAAACDVSRHVCVGRSSPPDPSQSSADDAGRAAIDAAAAETGATDLRCDVPNKPTALVPVTVGGGDSGTSGHITGAVTLDCSKDWILRGRVFVHAGGTLTIAKGTTIHAEKASNAGLVVLPGGRLVAAGERNAPVVFTSDQVAPLPGDWRGVVILGRGPATAGATFLVDPEMPFGGANADDDSGVLSYVRIEYGALGLSLAGVGRKTLIDSVEIRKSVDNCFTFEGGTVDAKHLVCQFPGDESFEFRGGYAGRLQHLFGQKTPAGGAENNGVLSDAAFPVIYNATLCGDSLTDRDYGVVVRNGSRFDMNNAIVTNWATAIDVRDAVASPLEVRGSIAFGNTENPAAAEDPAITDPALTTFNDDLGFDELAWFRDPARANAVTSPGLAACSDAKNPRPYPGAPLTAAARTPPSDGFFDIAARHIGAFRDESDAWMRGTWVRFDDK